MRVFSTVSLQPDLVLTLDAGVARHIQVLRMQPGQNLRIFDGRGGEFDATISEMGRNTVSVQVGAHLSKENENQIALHLYVGVPANERMDWLIEKATELGVSSITPVMTERSVVRLSGERADKRVRHWQAIAIAACEQCGRNRVPTIHPVQSLAQAMKTNTAQERAPAHHYRLSLSAAAMPLASLVQALQQQETAVPTLVQSLHLFSGPEGGFSAGEEDALERAGWQALSLGKRTLRAETAPIMALSVLGLLH